MLKMFYPCEYVESVFAIDYAKLYSIGYKAVIFDIDNTLVHHGEDSTEEVDELFRHIHKTGLKTLLLSNNNEARIKSFIRNIDTEYISDADKPEITNYLKAVEILGIKKEETVFVGDQLFTDIYGANKSGIDSILVKFMRYPHEKKIGKKRTLEKIILKFYGMNKKYRNRIGNITIDKENSKDVVEKR